MTPREFDHLAELLLRRSGLLLTPDKKNLAEDRLKPVAALFGFRDTAALFAELPYPSEEVARAITEAMTTNETSFFRDPALFDFLAATVLPGLTRRRAERKRIRIWCAAAATGQEAYSLAILLDRAEFAAEFAGSDWKIDLIATDLSESAIARAGEGLYSQYEVERGLPPEMRETYFARDGTQWRVSARLRRMIAFRTFNLLDHFGWLGELDVVLCRNVLIYFDPHIKEQIQAKLASVLAPDGYLLLGRNEGVPEAYAPDIARRGHLVPASISKSP